MSALRLTIRFLIEALKHLAYDLATFVADYVKHVSDLEVAQALHQRGRQQLAEQKQSSDHEAGDQRHDPGPIAIEWLTFLQAPRGNNLTVAAASNYALSQISKPLRTMRDAG